MSKMFDMPAMYATFVVMDAAYASTIPAKLRLARYSLSAVARPEPVYAPTGEHRLVCESAIPRLDQDQPAALLQRLAGWCVCSRRGPI